VNDRLIGVLMKHRLRAFLHANDGLFFCGSCAARAIRLTPHDLRDAWVDLLTAQTIEASDAECVGCGQLRTVARVSSRQLEFFPDNLMSQSTRKVGC
jgi:hypothetical protein